jgi:hypothetical protein
MEKHLIWAQALTNITMVAGIVIAAMHFERAAILWFLFLPTINSMLMATKKRESE